MKLKNKKTGEVFDAIIREKGGAGSYSFIVCDIKAYEQSKNTLDETHFVLDEYWSLAELNQDWEDVGDINVTNIPLIKDEKIRKAVRAWDKANSYGKDDVYEFNDFSTGWKSWSLEHKGNGDDNEIHFNGGIDFDKVEHQGYYTIEELCGELQNDANM